MPASRRLGGYGRAAPAQDAAHPGDQLTRLEGLHHIVVATAFEWYDLIYNHDLTIWTNLFGTTYYTLVGFHAGHVTVGLTLLTLVLIFGLTGALHRAHAERVEVLSWYWHFVDAVWVVVFTTVYVIGR